VSLAGSVPPPSPGIRPDSAPPPSLPAVVHSRDGAEAPPHRAVAATPRHRVPSSWSPTTSTASSDLGSRAFAARFRTWGSSGFTGSRRRLDLAIELRTRAGSSPTLYPSKVSPRRQPCRITATDPLLTPRGPRSARSSGSAAHRDAPPGAPPLATSPCRVLLHRRVRSVALRCRRATIVPSMGFCSPSRHCHHTVGRGLPRAFTPAVSRGRWCPPVSRGPIPPPVRRA
jgi:hypothetical protein